MNDDLISRSKLIEELYSVAYACSDDNVNEILSKQLESNIECIKQQPTAYDVDKVVEKLKHSQYMLFEEVKQATSYSHEEELIENIRHYEYAINIVKAGGTSDNN